MKLGVAFSVFSGLEFLKPALQNVREFAAHVVLVYSTQSNEGHPAPAYMLPLLRALVQEGLADELVEHRLPFLSNNPLKMQEMQRGKRRLGRVACAKAGCTHYMTRDCDEFYDPMQFAKAIEVSERYELTICGLYDYVGSPTLRAKGVSPLHLPFIHAAHCNMLPKDYGVLMDHERTCDAASFYIFPREELCMHHMTAVRYDAEELRRKFYGHSHFMRLGTEAVAEYLKMINTASSSPDYERVPDVFGIQSYWDSEFRRLHETVS